MLHPQLGLYVSLKNPVPTLIVVKLFALPYVWYQNFAVARQFSIIFSALESREAGLFRALKIIENCRATAKF